MKKIFLVICIIMLFICGCEKENNNSKFYLDNKYYKDGKYIKIDESDIKKNKGSYVLFTYNSFCTLAVPCEDVFEDFMKENNIRFLSIPFDEFKDTYLYDTVKYAPSIIVVHNGEVVAYLDANNDDDLSKYQDTLEFKNWLSKYIYLEK